MTLRIRSRGRRPPRRGWPAQHGPRSISPSATRCGVARRCTPLQEAPPRREIPGLNKNLKLGSNAVEQIGGCHRSKSAEVYIGAGVNGLNLACSGARTNTQPFSSGSDFKPGIDFYNDGAGHLGQALMLQSFAATHNVRAVALLIGANNYHFADLVQTCVEDFLLSPSWWPNYCYDDSDVRSNFTSTNIAVQTDAIRGAVLNVRRAMASAGYADSAYTIVAQTYWNPVPRGAQIRYPQSGYTRQTVGGCGIWNRDADWANDTAFGEPNTWLQ